MDAIPADVVHALASDESISAAHQYVSPYLAGVECRGLWRMRSKQIIDTPGDAPWITRLMIDPDVTMPVGVAGFHGAPDATGMVEIGYRVDPGLRRRGHARRSVEILLDVARRHPDVRTVRASISPDNAPSSAFVESFGFIEVGEQWDDEDGLETVYEVPASTAQQDQAVRTAPR
ncbi:GNAT family N-acetyltransferase [Rhodococcus sp. 06-235-1A]|uniref:GNAT family N-acetyltransferase n=1 Tax=Rhodococcus sp. 06-235-1A TaxID=2022508 RepID=UPI00211B3548|nr:GNAT family protein [Rhodococcus sp. 06-235-1A]